MRLAPRSTRFLRLAGAVLLATSALLAGCTPSLDGKLACANSLQCPSGYACDAASGKCKVGETRPELVIVTSPPPTVSGGLTVLITAVDPAGIDTVSGQLGSAAAVAATAGTGANSYQLALDTVALLGNVDASPDLVITAKNKKGQTGTATLKLHVDNAGPTIGTIDVAPSGGVFTAQASTITFTVGETIQELPVVQLTPPGAGATPRSAQFISYTAVSGTYTYSFTPAFADPTGSWGVSVTARDDRRNTTAKANAGTLTVKPTPAGGGGALSLVPSSGNVVPTELRANSAATVTATFSKSLLEAPSVLICPPAAGNPACASGTGAIINASGSPTSGVFSFSVSAGPGPSGEGVHVVTVQGKLVTGETVSASVNFHFDFTPPQLGAVGFAAGSIPLVGGVPAFSVAPGATPSGMSKALVIAALVESPAPGTFTATLDEGSASFTPLNLFQNGNDPLGFDLPLDGTTLPDGTHSVVFHTCDLANNCASKSFTFEVHSSTPDLIIDPLASAPVKPTTGYGAAIYSTALLAPNAPSGYAVVAGQLKKVSGGGNSTYLIAGAPTPDQTYANHPYRYNLGANLNFTSPQDDGPYYLSIGGADVYGNAYFVSTAASPPYLNVDGTPASIVWVAQPAVVAASQNATFKFHARSSGVDEQLTASQLSACLDPAAGATSCSGAAQQINNLTLFDPTTAQFVFSPGSVTTDTQRTVMVSHLDAAGNRGFTTVLLRVDGVKPGILGYSWDKTLVGAGSTATVTLNASEALSAATPSTGASGITAGALQLSGNSTPPVYRMTFTMPAACTGAGDGVPVNISLSALTDSASNVNNATFQLGTLTCSASRVASVDSTRFKLQRTPYADGSVRSFVSANPGAVTGQGAGGLVGVTLRVSDQSNGAVVGIGPVASDGSIAAFQLSSAITQVGYLVLDALGNQASVFSVPVELDLGFAGAAVANTSNTIQAYNASGNSGWLDPNNWLDGGHLADGGNGVADAGAIGPGAGNTVVALQGCLADGGSGPTLCGLSDSDGVVTVITGQDAGPTFAWDLYEPANDAGPGSFPNYRFYVASASIGSSLYVYGGQTYTQVCTPTCNTVYVAAEPDSGVVHALNFDQETTCTADGGCAGGITWSDLKPPVNSLIPSSVYGGAMIADSTNLWMFGGYDSPNGNQVAQTLRFDPSTSAWTDTGEQAAISSYQLDQSANSGSTTLPYYVQSTGGPFDSTTLGNSRQMFSLYYGYCRAFQVDAPILPTAANSFRNFNEQCGYSFDLTNPWSAQKQVYGQTLAYDSTQKALLVFGGNINTTGSIYAASNQVSFAVWNPALIPPRWDWKVFTVTGPQPAARFDARGYYDPVGKKFVILKGNVGSNGVFQDAWEFSPVYTGVGSPSGTWQEITDNSPLTAKFGQSQWNEITRPIQIGQGVGIFTAYWSQYAAPYIQSAQGFGYHLSGWLGRRETQQRLLVRAPLNANYPCCGSTQTVEVLADNVDPNAQVYAWQQQQQQWDLIGLPKRRGFGFAVDAILPTFSSNQSPYLYDNTLYLMVKRGPGSAFRANDPRSLQLDNLQMIIRQ